jgi:linoleoyl-CoA desaturase
MKTMRFTGKDKNDREFVMQLRKEVNEYFKNNHLSTKANAAMVFKTIAMLSIYFAPFILLLVINLPLWAAMLCWFTMGVGVAGVGMGVMHDANHGAYSKHTWVNNLLSGTMYLLGANVLNWKIQHNVLHHTYTNISGMDEDIDQKGPIRLSENLPLRPYHRFQYIYAFFFYGFMTLSMYVNDFKRLAKYQEAGLLAAQNKSIGTEFAKMLFRKVMYALIAIGLPLWLTEYSVAEVLVGFFLMQFVASLILSFVFQMAHVVEGAEQYCEAPEMSSEWHVHQLITTSDFARNSPILSWYVGGLNYQIEHHLFPTICHVHYKALAPIVQRVAEHHNIPYNLKKGFSSALVSHVRRLKQLGARYITS